MKGVRLSALVTVICKERALRETHKSAKTAREDSSSDAIAGLLEMMT